jgi:hypothetical protein
MKECSCSYKLRYKVYLELIYGCLSLDMYTELTRIRIQYGDITYVYIKAHDVYVSDHLTWDN